MNSKSSTPQVWTVLTMLEWATDYFQQKSIDSPRLSIEWLLSAVLKCKRLDLYLQYDRPLHSEELAKLRSFVKRRAKHEPIQYIVGETDFFNSKIEVNPSVLIPRPETEELVEFALQKLPEDQTLDILDIGTGSGCIAIAIKKARPNWKVSAIDISPEALKVASSNSKLNDVEIEVSLGNLFAEKILNGKKFDVIISNPPYIHPVEKKDMSKQVVEFEPHLALFTENPIAVYQQLLRIAKKQLKHVEHAQLFAELHEDLSDKMLDILETIDGTIFIEKDLSGKNRFLHFLVK